MKPSFASPGDRDDRADQQREGRRQRDRPLGILVGVEQRDERRRDHRAERRVGAEHEDLRRSEQRVRDEAEDRRVEAGDRREAGELRVGHPLRHQQRGQHEARDEVLAQPLRPVRLQVRQPRCDRRSHQPRSRPSSGAAGVMSGRRTHPEGVGDAEEAGDHGDEERDLEAQVPGIGVDGEDLLLDVRRLVGDLPLELGVAHHLRVGLQRLGDLLLLGRRDHGARLGHVGEAEGQGPEHDAAGHREPEREAEVAGGRVHTGGLADAVLLDGGEGEVVELGDQQAEARAGDDRAGGPGTSPSPPGARAG